MFKSVSAETNDKELRTVDVVDLLPLISSVVVLTVREGATRSDWPLARVVALNGYQCPAYQTLRDIKSRTVHACWLNSMDPGAALQVPANGLAIIVAHHAAETSNFFLRQIVHRRLPLVAVLCDPLEHGSVSAPYCTLELPCDGSDDNMAKVLSALTAAAEEEEDWFYGPMNEIEQQMMVLAIPLEGCGPRLFVLKPSQLHDVPLDITSDGQAHKDLRMLTRYVFAEDVRAQSIVFRKKDTVLAVTISTRAMLRRPPRQPEGGIYQPGPHAPMRALGGS